MALPVAIAELVSQPEPSRRLGQFALIQQLGSGGFAPVWSAREEYAGRELRTVALKLFSLEINAAGQSGSVEQVLEEARALCRVEHPNIVRFHSVVIDAERRVAGFAMEHLAGTALDRALVDGPFTLTEAVDVGAAVASALAAVHRAGIVHRDVKPGNIIETAAGYKLIDFGLAHGARDAAGRTATTRAEFLDVPCPPPGSRVSTVDARFAESPLRPARTLKVELAAGTMGYIDPECLAHAISAGPASDLYALGATLFELVTGRLPAEGEGNVLRGEVMDGRKRPPRVSELVPDIDEEFSDLVHQLLSPTREGRPSSADWVLTKLEQLRHALAGKDRPRPPEEIGPFRGLSRFEASDRGVYFGRSLEVAQALHMLRIRGLVALLGPSGSGKSSLASAGLLPAIEDGLLQTWPTAWDTLSMTPGGDPVRSLFGRLRPLVTVGEGATQAKLLAALAERAEQQGRGIVLLVDQLEELATVSMPKARDWLAEFIALSAEQAVPGFKLVVTARRDLLDSLLELSALGRVLLRSALLVDPMTGLTWADVLDQALAAYGYRCEDGYLRDELVGEIEQTASAMPLVGFALSRLWEMRDRERRIITRAALRTLDGIAGALAQHAQGTFDRLTRGDALAERTARRVLLALTTAHGTRTTKSDEEIEALAGRDSAVVVAAFEQARLLVRTPSGLTLAHEVLLGSWQLLRGWLHEEREARTLVEELEHDAARFKSEPDKIPLWSRRRLQKTAELLARGNVGLSPGARAFLEAGGRAARLRRVGAVATAALTLAVAVGGVTSYLVAINAERARTVVALDGERASRKLAEERTRDVQAAQQRIDELLRNVADSPTKDAVRELQAAIRAPEAQASRGANAPRGPSVLARELRPTPAASAASEQPTPAVEGPKIKVQDKW